MRILLALAFAALPACAAEIGDECETAIDCSQDGDRICDLAQRGGYCTVEDCTPDSCPDDALCVEFEHDTQRRARRYCMAACETGSDCRDGYFCASAEDQGAAVVDGHRRGKYCAQEE